MKRINQGDRREGKARAYVQGGEIGTGTSPPQAGEPMFIYSRVELLIQIKERITC